MITVKKEWIPIGYARFATLSSAVNIGTATPTAGTAFSALPKVPRHAIVSFETQSVRVRDDGTNPTSSEGELCLANEKLTFENSTDAIKATTVIETAASASMTVRYYI